jgi:hypothetical protein
MDDDDDDDNDDDIIVVLPHRNIQCVIFTYVCGYFHIKLTYKAALIHQLSASSVKDTPNFGMTGC